MARLLDTGSGGADNTDPMKHTPEHSTPPTPILVSWIGDTELKVMAKCGNDEERSIAFQVIKGDKEVDDKTIEDKLREMDLERAYSSVHLILGDAGTGHPEFRVPESIPRFGRLLLMFSRGEISGSVFKDKFLPRYRSFLWRSLNRKPDDLNIDVRYLPIDPWNYEKVYNATRDALKGEIRTNESLDHIYFNLTPGTVTQEITLALIGKEMDGVRFIQVNKNRRDIAVCDLPWDLNLIRHADAESIAKDLPPEADNLFPETDEGRAMRQRLSTIAAIDVDCLLLGETGVGKNWIAETVIRPHSSRKNKPFVSFNCAALGGDLNMLRSQLFGSRKGGYTGAEFQAGLAKQADGGILFLDEVECLNADAQGVLLDFVQPKPGAKSQLERTIWPVGGKEEKVTVRIVSATNCDLWEMVQKGTFREDLYWRLAPLTFRIPSLRERRLSSDSASGASIIERMAKQFLVEFGRLLHRRVQFSDGAIRLLEDCDWRGNVRQLRNVLRRAVVFAPATGCIDEAVIRRELENGERFSARDMDANENIERLKIGCNASPRSDDGLVVTPPQDIKNIPDEQLRDSMKVSIAAIKARFATEAVRRAGTQSAAEKLLGVRRQTVSKWITPKQIEVSNER